jgi:hypothetical protein
VAHADATAAHASVLRWRTAGVACMADRAQDREHLSLRLSPRFPLSSHLRAFAQRLQGLILLVRESKRDTLLWTRRCELDMSLARSGNPRDEAPH